MKPRRPTPPTGRRGRRQAEARPLAPFTNIERTILRALVSGLRSKDIAKRIRRSRATVETYVRVLRAKYGARSRTQLVAQVLRAGILD